MTYSQCPPNLYASPHHCADTSDIIDIFGSSIGDPDLFYNELYYPLPRSTLSSYSVDALSFDLDSAFQSCTERTTDLEIPPPHTNGAAGEGRTQSSSTIGHKDPTERNDTCYHYYTSHVSCANDSADAYNMTFSASFPSLNVGCAPVSEGPRISPEYPAIVPNVTSQPDTTAIPCNTLLPQALNSSITSNEITTCDNTSSESIQEELFFSLLYRHYPPADLVIYISVLPDTGKDGFPPKWLKNLFETTTFPPTTSTITGETKTATTIPVH
ncbi:hypothetical protein EV421DRAFT_1741219 [Armillaria borealis]|uniref:Uncharacterized protein n=1 Tax=Armillaria borealis TaxID=47425 RepID=A0AA39J2E4_9AGAR|nr:hypothetical protein EV421DRAFT_1741219 [Armillaria borealis]